MKNLKKLSAAFMLAALLSSSLTSCIDNEVSPLVETIYAEQASLLAAQAAVQNAEAQYRLAQAEYQQSLAAVQNANAAQTMQLIEGLKIAQEAAQIVVDEAKADLDLYLAQLAYDLQQAGAAEAATLLATYKGHTESINTDTNALLEAKGKLATAELLLKNIGTTASPDLVTWEYFLQTQVDALADKKAAIAANDAKIVAAELAMANPTARETQIADLEDQVAVLRARKVELVAEMALAKKDKDDAQAAIDAVVAFMHPGAPSASPVIPRGEYFTTKDAYDTAYSAYQTDSLAIVTQTAIIVGLNATIADYAATTTTLQADVDAAKAVIGSNAAGTHANNHATGSGLLLAIDNAGDDVTAATNALGTYGTTGIYANSARTGTTAAPLTAQDILWNADLALLQHNTDFSALTATYNAAATALEAAQTAFDGATYAADLQTAKDARDLEITERQAAIDAYDAAAIAFGASTTGSVFADGPDAHASAFLSGYDSIDLGETGIHTDIAGDTYMRVDTWKETTIGSGLYVPASFYATKYNSADLAAHITTIKADVVSTDNLNILVDTDVWVWEATGTGAMIVNDGAGAAVNGDDHALTAAEAALADSDNLAVFVNVELDDSSISNLYTFNTTTNMLGSDDFTTRPFFTSGAGTVASPYVYNGVLNPTTTANSGYDSTPNANGEADTAHNMLTAQAELWNAQLEVFKKQNAFDLGDDALVAAQATFDAQEILFNDGLATRTTLEGTVTTAAADVTTATGVVTAANTALSALQNELGIEYILTGTAVGTQVVRPSTSLPLAWDAHDNDGLTTPAFDILPSASYDSALPAGKDSLTAYAVLWNAERLLAIHTATTLAGYNTQLTTATNLLNTATLEAADGLILVAKYKADLDALQAKYDALLLTPLYAALNVTLVEATQAYNVLDAEDKAADAVIEALYGKDSAATPSVHTDGLIDKLASTVTDWALMIKDAKASNLLLKADLPGLEAAVISSQNDYDTVMNDAIEALKADIAELEANIAATQAVADVVYQLMLDALGN